MKYSYIADRDAKRISDEEKKKLIALIWDGLHGGDYE